MTAGMPETVFKTDQQREYLLSWNVNRHCISDSLVALSCYFFYW